MGRVQTVPYHPVTRICPRGEFNGRCDGINSVISVKSRRSRPADEERVRAFLLEYLGVTAIRDLLFTFVGPGRIWIVARINIDDGLRSGHVGALVRGIESGMKHESKDVHRVDVVPIGEAQPASRCR